MRAFISLFLFCMFTNSAFAQSQNLATPDHSSGISTDIIIAIAAAIQAIALIITIVVMVKSGQKQLRSYILIETLHLDDVAIGKIPYVRIAYKNFGQTPAIGVHNIGVISLDDFFTNTKLVISKIQHIFSIWFKPIHLTDAGPPVPPNTPWKSTVAFDRPLTEDEINKIRNKELSIRLIGSIVYKDVFNKLRVTEYRAFSTGNKALTDHGMTPDNKGNRCL